MLKKNTLLEKASVNLATLILPEFFLFPIVLEFIHSHLWSFSLKLIENKLFYTLNSRNIKIANLKSQKFERLMVLTKLRDRVLIHENRDNLFADEEEFYAI